VSYTALLEVQVGLFTDSFSGISQAFMVPFRSVRVCLMLWTKVRTTQC